MDISKKPFYLDKEDIHWVMNTYASMSLEEKVGQLFCPIGYSTDPNYLQHELLDKYIGGLFFRDGVGAEMRDTFAFAQSRSRIPLLIPSNLETGGNGAATDGTPYGRQMAVAAADDPKYAYRLGKIACSEGAALGINWAFAPVVDLDLNFRNPITNVRTFGDDPERVICYAKEYMRAAKECKMAVSIKHFPGDGVDERDQHILTSVNSMSCEKWDETYGHIYKELIDADALTVMVGHIAQPAYVKHFSPEHENPYLPATLSPELLQQLLREQLGFEGLITTDATPMIGFASAMPRKQAVPYAIEAGCDMILFNHDLTEDYDYMMQGLQNGILSEQRLDEAVMRILATKAALGLHKKAAQGTLVPGEKALRCLQCSEHVQWARELADKTVTLVKDTAQHLPMQAKKTPRVLLEILGDFPSNERVAQTITKQLEQRGFSVTPYQKEDFSSGVDTVTEFCKKYDMVLYIANIENASNKTTNRINWHTFFGAGNNVPWFVKEVPTVFASVGNPYHLFDVPMIQTYVNAYSNHDYILEALVEKLCGERPFFGKSPIDPFCGREELMR